MNWRKNSGSSGRSASFAAMSDELAPAAIASAAIAPLAAPLLRPIAIAPAAIAAAPLLRPVAIAPAVAPLAAGVVSAPVVAPAAALPLAVAAPAPVVFQRSSKPRNGFFSPWNG